MVVSGSTKTPQDDAEKNALSSSRLLTNLSPIESRVRVYMRGNFPTTLFVLRETMRLPCLPVFAMGCTILTDAVARNESLSLGNNVNKFILVRVFFSRLFPLCCLGRPHRSEVVNLSNRLFSSRCSSVVVSPPCSNEESNRQPATRVSLEGLPGEQPRLKSLEFS